LRDHISQPHKTFKFAPYETVCKIMVGVVSLACCNIQCFEILDCKIA
jgi:hypothetical protein